MKIFLDTASLKEIREAATLGVVDGITTNPSLLAKETGDPERILVEICNTIDGPISGEVVATDDGALDLALPPALAGRGALAPRPVTAGSRRSRDDPCHAARAAGEGRGGRSSAAHRDQR